MEACGVKLAPSPFDCQCNGPRISGAVVILGMSVSYLTGVECSCLPLPWKANIVKMLERGKTCVFLYGFHAVRSLGGIDMVHPLLGDFLV